MNISHYGFTLPLAIKDCSNFSIVKIHCKRIHVEKWFTEKYVHVIHNPYIVYIRCFWFMKMAWINRRIPIFCILFCFVAFNEYFINNLRPIQSKQYQKLVGWTKTKRSYNWIPFHCSWFIILNGNTNIHISTQRAIFTDWKYKTTKTSQSWPDCVIHIRMYTVRFVHSFKLHLFTFFISHAKAAGSPSNAPQIQVQNCVW